MISSFKKKQKINNNIPKLQVNNAEITDTREICNVFNKYFTSVGRDLVAKLTNNNPSSSPNHEFTAYCEGPMINSMYCEPVTSDELLKLINALKNGKSPGFDNIGPKIIKHIS